MFTGQSDQRESSIGVPSSQVSLGCIKLLKNSNSDRLDIGEILVITPEGNGRGL